VSTKPSVIFGIDPGNNAGVCYLRDGELQWCALEDGKNPWTSVPGGFHLAPRALVVIELPQIYRAGSSEGDPNDLVKVAYLAGGYGLRAKQLGARVVTALPAEWKGQVKKPIHNARVLSGLTMGELRMYEQCTESVAPSKRNNVIDAIGLAKWAWKVELWRRPL